MQSQRLAPVILVLTALGGGPLDAQSRHEHHYDEVDPWAGVGPREQGPDSAAVAGFFKALASSDPLICQFAVNNIGNNWGPQHGEYETGKLAGENSLEAARRTLNRPVNDAAAISLLSHSLGNQDPCMRRGAAEMLGRSGNEQAVRQLRGALRHESARVREAAALGLASAEDATAFHDLTRALHDRERAVVRMAAYALGELEDARAVKPLGELLRSSDAETRATAANALGEIEDIRVTDRLTPLVRDADPRVRMAAVEALGEIEDHRASGALADALRDREVDVRRAAAEALGEVESPKSADALARAISDPDMVVRRLAAQALGELDNLKRAPPSLVAALDHADTELSIIAAMSLGEIGDSTAVPALSEAYAGAEPRYRYAIVKALAETDDHRGDSVLAQAARDKDQAIRHTAAEALKDRRHDDDE